MSRVAIIGSGYVGLVTGAGLAELGHEVVCVDLDPHRVATINRGEVPFHEPGLESLVARHAGKGLLASGDLRAAVADAEFIFLAVGTPGSVDGGINLDQVVGAARSVGQALAESSRFQIVITKSTVVPGTTKDTILPLLENSSSRHAGIGFGVAVNPEFLTEGTAVADFFQPDRIVVGAFESSVAKAVLDLYGPLGEVPSLVTSPSTAELVKYSSNALLATLISFSNELANLAEALEDVDIVEVMRGLHSSRYLTMGGATASIASFLEAGCGFGGSCLPKDTRALIARGAELEVDMPLLRAVLDINRDRAGRVMRVLRRHLPQLSGRRVTVLGLAFKPDTDDVRESPAFPIIDALLAAGAEVGVHDPVVGPSALPARWDHRLDFHADLRTAVAGADGVVLVTRWEEYRDLPELLAAQAEPPVLVDGRRLLSPGSVPRYDGIGR